MGLSEDKAAHLIAEGYGCQLGQLAGNSIPVRMTELVARDEAQRISRYKQLLAKRRQGMFCLMQPLAGLCDCKFSATFLIFVGLVAADALVWNKHAIPGMVHEAN